MTYCDRPRPGGVGSFQATGTVARWVRHTRPGIHPVGMGGAVKRVGKLRFPWGFTGYHGLAWVPWVFLFFAVEFHSVSWARVGSHGFPWDFMGSARNEHQRSKRGDNFRFQLLFTGSHGFQ